MPTLTGSAPPACSLSLLPHKLWANKLNNNARRHLRQIWQSGWLALDVWSHGRLSMSPSRGCYETAIAQCTAAFFGSSRILIHKIRDMPRTCGSQGTLCDVICIGSSEARLLGRRTGQLDVVRTEHGTCLLIPTSKAPEEQQVSAR